MLQISISRFIVVIFDHYFFSSASPLSWWPQTTPKSTNVALIDELCYKVDTEFSICPSTLKVKGDGQIRCFSSFAHHERRNTWNNQIFATARGGYLLHFVLPARSTLEGPPQWKIAQGTSKETILIRTPPLLSPVPCDARRRHRLLSSITDIPADSILELFGKTFFEFCQDSGYDKILQVLGATPRDFLQVSYPLLHHHHLLLVHPLNCLICCETIYLFIAQESRCY